MRPTLDELFGDDPPDEPCEPSGDQYHEISDDDVRFSLSLIQSRSAYYFAEYYKLTVMGDPHGGDVLCDMFLCFVRGETLCAFINEYIRTRDIAHCESYAKNMGEWCIRYQRNGYVCDDKKIKQFIRGEVEWCVLVMNKKVPKHDSINARQNHAASHTG